MNVSNPQSDMNAVQVIQAAIYTIPEWDKHPTPDPVPTWEAEKLAGKILAALADAGLVVCGDGEAVKRADVLAIIDATIDRPADSSWRSYPAEFKQDFIRRLDEGTQR